MKTVFDREVREELIHRIGEIDEKNIPQWGKMNVFQMLRHNTYWNRWIQGEGDFNYHQAFLGKLFGKIALRRMVKDERPFDKNILTSQQFKVNEHQGDIEFEKELWISLIRAYKNYDNPSFIHDFFGKMNREEIGILAYKHTDHHLRQFGQ